MNRYRGMKTCFIVFLILLVSFATSAFSQDISEEAHKHMNWGLAALEMAKTNADLEDALKEFAKAAELAPGWADAYYNLGLVQDKLGKEDDVLKNWKKYLELSPNAVESEVLEIKHRINNLEYKAKKKREQLEQMNSLRVLIPAGEFLMGSPKGKVDKDEYPQHKVFLDAYYIDKYEVTVAEYRKFCQETGRNMPPAPSWGWQDNHPIVYVSWNDAVAYANYYGKRLPTEAEWEKAARAGSTTNYCFGDAEANLKDYAWYSVNSNNQTHPVGTKKPNAFGLYDMQGNVWEWCNDWCDANYYSNSPTNNPKGPVGPDRLPSRVLRGGAWFVTAGLCRSAVRCGSHPASQFDVYGFRCASSP